MSWKILEGAALVVLAAGLARVQPGEGLEEAKRAYEKGDYDRGVRVLGEMVAKEPRNGEAYLLLAKIYYELEQKDSAIQSAQQAVNVDPQSSVYHEWLGRAYGAKAETAGWFSALGLAKKSRKEFETAVGLDEHNFSAVQALVEYDCSAPGIAGGGEDKAQPEIAKIAALDASEGHYAAGNCRRQKKDFAAADREFTLALESQPKSADLVFDVGDYAMKREQPDRLVAVADLGGKLAPADPRAEFYRAVALVLRREKPAEVQTMLRDYLKRAPKRSSYPSHSKAHEWLGRLFENQGQREAAAEEYASATALDGKNKNAREALKRVRGN